VNRSELAELSTRLAQLADALGGRAPSAAGMLVWLDALGECRLPDILDVLRDWPKSHAKMPLPAEVLKLAREMLTSRTEAVADGYAKTARAPFSPAEFKGDPNCAEYRAFRAFYAQHIRRSKPAPKAWAERLRDREAAGEQLNHAQSEAWRRALRAPRKVDAQETDGEREDRAERDAIQSEMA